jgi:hypothetical protein
MQSSDWKRSESTAALEAHVQRLAVADDSSDMLSKYRARHFPVDNCGQESPRHVKVNGCHDMEVDATSHGPLEECSLSATQPGTSRLSGTRISGSPSGMRVNGFIESRFQALFAIQLAGLLRGRG